MFWRFGGYANISTLESILDKPDVTLEEILDESDLIQELKQNQAKLVEYLREDSVLEHLIKYVISDKVPESDDAAPATKTGGGGFFGKARRLSRSSAEREESDKEKKEKQRLKYAYVSCEILSAKVWSISEAVVSNTDLIRLFWEYVKADAPLDPIQSSYFTKVNEALLEEKPDSMFAILKSMDDVVPNLLKHVDCPSIMDLLLKLISLEKHEATQGIADWLQSQDLIPGLLSYISSEQPVTVQTSAGDFLKAIITISANATGQDSSVIGPNELTRQLVSEPCVQTLVDEMLKGGNPLTVGVGIIIEVIRKNNSDYDSDAQVGPEPKSSDPIYLGTLLRQLADRIPNFMELITSPNHTVATETGSKSVPRKEMKVAWGERIEPLGFDRFKTCELMAELLHCSNMGLLNENGAEAQIKARDAERERLKAAGKLESAQEPIPSTEFGTSVDSGGFHHAEVYTALGESPESLKRSEAQNNGDDEGFEKVALSEAIPGDDEVEESDDQIRQGADRDIKDDGEFVDEPLFSDPKPLQISKGGQGSSRDAEAENVSENGQTGNDIEESDFANTSGAGALGKQDDSTSSQPPTSKRRPSLLSYQIETANDTSAEEDFQLPSYDEDSHSPAPPPLFSKQHAKDLVAGRATVNKERTDETTSSTDSAGEPGPTTEGDKDVHDEQSTELPAVQREDDGSPVVGDYLKIMFVEHRVVPTILEFFFRFPWNNFLHNVVYDVVQQVFNGTMERGYNRNLAVDLFETGGITDRIMEGQKQSEKAEEAKMMRLGYMGHLTLIAEEVVKFTERQPAELLSQSVVDKTMDPDWIHYVEHTLAETRDRDNAILGGVRPDVSIGTRQAVLNSVNSAQGGFGGAGSAALISAGLGGSGSGLDSMDLASSGAGGYGFNSNALLSGFGGSDDDEEEDELEEGELGDGGINAMLSRQTIDDDDEQLNLSAIDDPNDQSQTQGNQPLMPSPLAVTPSRARRQFAARMAEKKRLAALSNDGTMNDEGDFKDDEDRELGPSGRLEAGASASAGTGLSRDDPRSPIFREDTARNAVHDSEDDEDDDEDDDEREENAIRGLLRQVKNRQHVGEEDDDEEPPPGIKRQSTREAIQRRPLDLGDEEEESAGSDGETESSAASESEQEEDSAATSGSSSARAQEQSAKSQAAVDAGKDKKREQEKLLQQWGLGGSDEGESGTATEEEEEDDDDDEDEDDEPVEMGSKYLKKLPSRE